MEALGSNALWAFIHGHMTKVWSVMLASKLRRSLGVMALLSAMGQTQAEPWSMPGDTVLRHDLQYLSDIGLAPVPLTTWPLTNPDLAYHLLHPSSESLDRLDVHGHAALRRVQKRLRAETRTGLSEPKMRLSLAANPVKIRGFADTPRDNAEVEAGVAWMGQRFAARLNLTAVHDPDDDKNFRLDKSYAGLALGNWLFSAGAMPRYWGPAWDGSLALGNDARPVPSLSVERNYTTPFESKWLSWIGPWKFVGFIGQLESDRRIPDAKLVGARLTLKPFDSLEVGLTRTALWGGDGRDESWSSFRDLVKGTEDNTGTENEPGDQLAGFDVRWRILDFPAAVYVQAMGEDSDENSPRDWLGQLGFETWGSAEWFGGGTYRGFLEVIDTGTYAKLDRFYDGNFVSFYNISYEHFIYQSGYRYRGNSLGHGADNDTVLVSLGLMFTENRGVSWNGLLRWGKINRDEIQVRRDYASHTVSNDGEELFAAHLTNRRELYDGELELSVGAQYTEELGGSGSDWDNALYGQWRRGW